jgi:RecA/RadA recombinase
MPSRWARKTATDAAIAKFEKDFASTGIELTSADQLERPAVIPTGSLALDAALRIGGVPRGRIVELFGPEHAGKSTLADMIVAAPSGPTPTSAPPSSTPSTPSTPRGPRSWASTCPS